MSELPEPLQQVERTYVRWQGRKLSYFAGCDYFRLASHPAVLQAAHQAIDIAGINVSASRFTTGNHRLYGELETALARFFGVEAATLVSNGYVTNIVVAQALAGEFTHAFMDERAHVSLRDASRFLDCPVQTFRHQDSGQLAILLKKMGKTAKPILLTDGMFSHDGSIAPLDKYLKLLPRRGVLLVDDAHGAGTLGQTGKGSVEFCGLKRERVIQTATLSKAFGTYGGVILGDKKLRELILSRSKLIVGNTPLPLPLASAALAAVKALKADATLRERLALNTCLVKTALLDAGVPIADTQGPIIALAPLEAQVTQRLRTALLRAKVFPSLIRYLGGPQDGYYRFVLSSEHTAQQCAALVSTLTKVLAKG